MKNIMTTAILIAIASGAFAHGKATGIVRERMESMVTLADTMKSLVAISKSDQQLDLIAIQNAGQTLMDHAGENLVAFFPEGSTQYSDATPQVWSQPDDFERLALQLSEQGLALRGTDTPDALQAQIKQIGATCKACHAVYRQKSE